MKEHLDENMMAGYADWLNQVGPQPDEEILEHVAACKECKIEILSLADLVAKLDAEVASRTGSFRSNFPWRLVLRTAAALAGVFLLALLIEFILPDNKSNELVDRIPGQTDESIQDSGNQKNDSRDHQFIPATEVTNEEDPAKWAENFEINEAYETLIGATYRADITTKIIAPEFDQLIDVRTPLVVILADDSTEILDMIILNNKGDKTRSLKIYRDTTSHDIMDLNPGLYYWKLQNKDELLQVGKFRITAFKNQ